MALESHSQVLWLDRKNSWGRNLIDKLEGETGRKDQRRYLELAKGRPQGGEHGRERAKEKLSVVYNYSKNASQ